MGEDESDAEQDGDTNRYSDFDTAAVSNFYSLYC
jgi:hypothetical protein